MLRITGLRPLDEVYGGGMDSMMRLMLATLAGLAVSGLLVAVAGLYAFMSFTVVRRRRDIGIRSALGARPERVVATILARAFAQVALGIAIGVALTGSLDRLSGEGLLGEKSGLLLPLVAAAMALIGVLAAWGPARAGLRIQPTEALRADA